MLRKLGLSVAIASALVVGKVNALGMGEISVKSALNEPLYAEIKLLQVKNLSPLQIKSRMADLNDFALSGLATQRALSDVRFQIRVNPNGTGRIILTSKLPVTEPFMNFLVEVNWPSGRLIREYTLLLDPPSYTNNIQNSRNFNKPTEVVAPQRAPAAAAARPKSRAPAPSTTSNVKPGQYYIRNKDALWDIAVANRPDSSITSQQMMVLIQRKNPQAFPSENVNVMEANVLIDLPTKAELDALTPKQANDEVQRQTRLWRNGLVPKVVAKKPAAEKPAAENIATEQPAKDAMMKKPEDASAKPDQMKKPAVDDKSKEMEANKAMMAAEAAKLKAQEKEKGILNVVSPEDLKAKQEMAAKAEAMSLSASKDADKIALLQKENAELDTKLALSEESIDRLSREGEELSNKLDTIAKQLDDMNRLIMLKDEQLAAFQEERVLEDQARAEKEAAESNKSWLDKLLEDPVGLAAGISGWLLAIVAGVILLLRRRKKGESEEAGDEKSEPSISLPDEMIEDELDELEILDDPAQDKAADESSDTADESSDTADESSDTADDLADLGEVEDLDLDLDLDMDLDLDETLDEEMLDTASGAFDMDDEGDDLAAQLEAELNTGTDDIEDDDLDVLEGIDSLEFDLGETEALDEEANREALAELASVMDDDELEGADLDEPEDDELAQSEAQALDLELAEDLDITDVEEAESVDEDDILEAAADLGADLSLDDDEEIEAALAISEESNAAEGEQLAEAISETTVEDIELDIDDIEGITTLDDLEANEAQQQPETESFSEDDAEDLSELALDEDELDISDLSLEDDLSEDDILEAVNNPLDTGSPDLDMPDEELALDEADESVDALVEELEQEAPLSADESADDASNLTEPNADDLDIGDLDSDNLELASLEDSGLEDDSPAALDLDELDLEDVDLDALDLDDVDLSDLDVEDSLEAANLENPVVDDVLGTEDDGELEEALETLASEDADADLDDGLLELDESEELDSVDESLDELLAASENSTLPSEESLLDLDVEQNAESEAAGALALEDELDELLNSTDDEIALNEIQPEMDTDMEEAIDLLDGEDGVQMKLDLARAYMEMGDEEGAADIVAEIMVDGDEAQQQEAQALLQLNS